MIQTVISNLRTLEGQVLWGLLWNKKVLRYPSSKAEVVGDERLGVVRLPSLPTQKSTEWSGLPLGQTGSH
jgi:hypothetical protein